MLARRGASKLFNESGAFFLKVLSALLPRFSFFLNILAFPNAYRLAIGAGNAKPNYSVQYVYSCSGPSTPWYHGSAFLLTRRRLGRPSAPATLASRAVLAVASAVLAVASPFLVPWVARVGFMVCFGLGFSCFKMHNSSPASKSLQFVMVGTITQPGFESPIL